MKSSPQFELPAAGLAGVFNLAGEAGVDIDRVIEEQRQEIARECERKEFEARMQRTLAECPGVVGFDTPQSVGGKGKVVVEPARVPEAMAWLKRRFVVCERLELSDGDGLVIEVAPRASRKLANGKRVRVSWGPIEQFTLSL
jgi:hypothetical protein